MSIETLVNEVSAIAAKPHGQLKAYKEKGMKCIGVMPYYAPEELVYAAGMMPMGMWGSNKKTISRAKEYCRAKGKDLKIECEVRDWKELEEAGLVLAVFDLAAPLNEEDLEIARRCQGRPALAILNKQDLAGQGEAFTAAQQQLAPYFKAIIPLTARDAASLQPLCQAVAQLLGTANLDPNAAALCSARQLSAAKEARDALAEALNSQEDGFGLDAAGVCISDAQRALARLTGEDATEATIDEVFSTFCVGK